MKKYLHKPLIGLIGLATIGAGIGIAGIVSAAAVTNDTTTGNTNEVRMMRGHIFGNDALSRPKVAGNVTAVNGSVITVTDKDGTTYTINAGNAVFSKNGATGSIADITQGSFVAADGTLDGNILTATKVMSGMHGKGMHGNRGKHGVRGKVTAINGSTITITHDNGTTYSVDASKAKIMKMTTINATDIAVGDELGVHGTVSGTTVVAEHIVDGVPEK